MKFNLQKLNTEEQCSSKYDIFAVGYNGYTTRSNSYGWEGRFNEIPTCVPWELDKKFLYLDLPAGDVFDFIKKEINQQLTAIIRNEIERKKGMLDSKILLDDAWNDYKGSWDDYNEKVGYNTAISEDIAYFEKVLEEIQKNI